MAEPTGTILSSNRRRRVIHTKGRIGVVETEPESSAQADALADQDEGEESLNPTFLDVCWPTVFGVLLAVIAERLRAKVILTWGDLGDRLIFPWVQIAARPELGLSDTIQKLVLQLQFPLTGLYATWNLRRRYRIGTTIAQIAFVYLVTAFVLWLLTKPGAAPGT